MKTLYICPNKEMLKENKKLINFKIMDFNCVYKKLTFDYNKKTVYFLMQKYNVKYDVAITYLNNLYNLNDVNDSKMNKLREIKNYLDENNLLIYDTYFTEYLKNTNVVIKGYSYFSKKETKVINKLKQITKITIEKEETKKRKTNIYKFNSVEQEVFFVANSISNLLETTDINDIKLVNVNKIYNNHIKRIFAYYNIPINIDNEICLYETSLIKYFLNNIERENILELIKENFKLENNTLIIYNKLIDILNEFYFTSYKEAKQILINIFKNTKIKLKSLKNKIDIVTLEEVKDEIVFLLNFNQGEIPTIKKDEDYFSDFFKENNNLDTSYEINKINKLKTIELINKIKNITISYKEKNGKQEFYISSIADELDLEYLEYNQSSTSKKYNEYLLANKLDKLTKYGVIDQSLNDLYSNYKIDYKTYNNQLTNNIKNINNKLRLSYSSMDNFYKCSYKYYLNSILKIGNYEETISTKIGNIFHYCLSTSLENYESEKDKLTLSNKEDFFITSLKEDLIEIIKVLETQKQFVNLKNIECEKNITVSKGNLTFIGFIDKIIYENNTLAIVDYKTGNPHLNLNNIIYGLDLQLCVYLYLIKKSVYADFDIAGFYLQKILPTKINREKNKTHEQQYNDSLKLSGYSNSNYEILYNFDDSYTDSKLIKGMKLSKNGFYPYSKVLNNEQLEKIVKIIDDLIDSAYKEITEGNFLINPKFIDKKNVSCDYCEFSDICYVNNKNLVYLKQYKDLEFLGDDNNAVMDE
ncbi:MAG: PD-(D/E)XK nuclease family protein [Mycoplasmatota bacterium]